MATDPSITVTPNGPYLVTNVDLVVKTPVDTAQGEPIAWVTGPTITTNERYALCRCGHSARRPFCDGTHSRIAFDGTEAPQDDTYADRSKDYEGPGITVHDDRSICVHAGFCSTATTNVWKMVSHSGDTEVRSQMIAMVDRCPSGALSYSFQATDRTEQDLATHVAIIPNGPLYVTGGVPVTLTEGELLETRNRITLCRCGESKNKPLCDGSHKVVGFKHTP